MQSVNHIAKEAAAKAAAEKVKQGMILGLGTGSTIAFFIAQLGQRCLQGLRVTAIPTSQQTLELALVHHIPIGNINEIPSIDMTVDGADEVDENKQMIKGAGGALLREKIVASMSREVIIIIDAHKDVKHLGNSPLPVEIIPFGYQATIRKLSDLGYKGTLRKTKNGGIYVSENQHYIYDISPTGEYKNLEKMNQEIRMIPGVVETGLFLNLATQIIIGYNDGNIKIR